MKSYRSCFVPTCKNTTKSAPTKIFVTVPRDRERRKLWFREARRKNEPSDSNFFCCEDHLDLKEDMENYIHFKLMGGRIKLKATAVPRFFAWQPHPTRSTSSSLCPVPEKLSRVITKTDVDAALVYQSWPCQTADEYILPDIQDVNCELESDSMTEEWTTQSASVIDETFQENNQTVTQRVFARLTENNILIPDVCPHHTCTPLINNVIIMGTTLDNLQSPLVKTEPV